MLKILGRSSSINVRKSPAHADPASIKASVASWNRHMALLDERLERTGAWVAGAAFTLADLVIGLAVHRFMRTPIERATLPAVDAYYDRLRERPASMPHIADDVP
jgi:glutathione S-transferase